MPTVLSPNMQMPVPVVSQDPGPDWANNVNACLSIIDSHTHTPDQGVPITPEAININADLPMNSENLTEARSVRFNPQIAVLTDPDDLGCLYEVNEDLYYNDGAGNNIRLTQGGSIVGAAGTITGLPSGTASASFSGGTFTFESATDTPANMNFGPITLGTNTVSPDTVTISPNVSQSSSYSLTLPIALPSTTSALSVDASGNMNTIVLSSSTYVSTITLTKGSGPGGTFSLNGQAFYYTRVGNYVTVRGVITISQNLGGTTNYTFKCTTPSSMVQPPILYGTFTYTGADGLPVVQRLDLDTTTTVISAEILCAAGSIFPLPRGYFDFTYQTS